MSIAQERSLFQVSIYQYFIGWKSINIYRFLVNKWLIDLKSNTIWLFSGISIFLCSVLWGKNKEKVINRHDLDLRYVPWPWPQVIFKIYPAYRFINLLQIVFAERRDFHIVSKIQSKQDSIIWFQNVPEDRFPWSRQPTVGWDHCFKVCRASFVLLFRF